VSRDNWYFDRDVAGAGAGLDTLVYPVSQLVTLLGPAKRAYAFVNTLIPNRILGDGETIDVEPPPRDPRAGKTVNPTVDDNATFVLEWEHGQQAVARALWGTSFVRGDTVVYGRHATLWLGGGNVVIHSPERPIPGAEEIEWLGHEKCYRVPVPERATEGLVEHYVDCILGLARPTCPGEQTLHVHEILFSGYEAARTGRVQELSTTFTPWHEVDPAFHDTRSRYL
jgi:predicted dehydrogenase